MRKRSAFTLIELIMLVWIPIVLAGIYGYIHNIYILVNMISIMGDNVSFTAMLALRAIGTVVFPLGAILGFI